MEKRKRRKGKSKISNVFFESACYLPFVPSFTFGQRKLRVIFGGKVMEEYRFQTDKYVNDGGRIPFSKFTFSSTKLYNFNV